MTKKLSEITRIHWIFNRTFVFRTTVRSRFSELWKTGIPAIRHETGRKGFLTRHVTHLILKSRCPTPTREFGNG